MKAHYIPQSNTQPGLLQQQKSYTILKNEIFFYQKVNEFIYHSFCFLDKKKKTERDDAWTYCLKDQKLNRNKDKGIAFDT